MTDALKRHWPEYLIEAALLGLFMMSAGAFTALIEHPASPLRQAIESGFWRRVLTGLAMGLTAITLTYSPWGKQSGAHYNPSVTLAFLRLGKVAPWDAFFYVLAQFVGGILGVLLIAEILGNLIADPAVNYAVTVPGGGGPWVAFAAEAVITFLLMTVILTVSNNPSVARFTGICAGALVATYISFEAPLSGMSMNPARTFGSAVGAQLFTALWVYFLAPPLGMLLAAELHTRRKTAPTVLCAKLHHDNDKRCIFRCQYGMATGSVSKGDLETAGDREISPHQVGA